MSVHTEKLAIADRLSCWTRYRRGSCKGCWSGCCTLPLEVSAVDLMRLGLLEEEEAAVSLRKASRRLIREGYVRTFNPSTQIFVIQQKPNRDCLFLSKERLCTVYEKRPEVCRRFPSIGPKPGYCPCSPFGRD